MTNIWQEWLKRKEAEAKAEIDYLENEYDKLSTEKTLITDEEAAMISALSKVSILPGSWDKRFVKSLCVGNIGIIPVMSDRQRYWLKKLYHKYRRQIK